MFLHNFPGAAFMLPATAGVSPDVAGVEELGLIGDESAQVSYAEGNVSSLPQMIGGARKKVTHWAESQFQDAQKQMDDRRKAERVQMGNSVARAFGDLPKIYGALLTGLANRDYMTNEPLYEINNPTSNWTTWCIPDRILHIEDTATRIQAMNEQSGHADVVNTLLKLPIYILMLRNFLSVSKVAREKKDLGMSFESFGLAGLQLGFLSEKLLSFPVSAAVDFKFYGAATMTRLTGHLASNLAFLSAMVGGYGMLMRERERVVKSFLQDGKNDVTMDPFVCSQAIQHFCVGAPKIAGKVILFTTWFMSIMAMTGHADIVSHIPMLQGLYEYIQPSIETTMNDPSFNSAWEACYTWAKGAHKFPFSWTIVMGSMSALGIGPLLYYNAKKLVSNVQSYFNKTQEGAKQIVLSSIALSSAFFIGASAVTSAWPQTDPHSMELYALGSFIGAAGFYIKSDLKLKDLGLIAVAAMIWSAQLTGKGVHLATHPEDAKQAAITVKDKSVEIAGKAKDMLLAGAAHLAQPRSLWAKIKGFCLVEKAKWMTYWDVRKQIKQIQAQASTTTP